MDIRNVGVITDGKKFHKSSVVAIIKLEGYKHNFVFLDGVSDLEKYIKQCDEVWCFGQCGEMLEYKMAKNLNSDIWQMG